MILLEVNCISTGYKKKQVLFDVSLSIKKGEVLLITGTNGSGKSTLLKAIYGLVPLWNDGRIYFKGTDITGNKTETLLQKGMAYVPQKNAIFEGLTVYENLELSGMPLYRGDILEKRIQEVMKNIPFLVSLIARKVENLSGGEQKLASIAMGLVSKPELLLLDEPLAGVSPNMSQKVIDVIGEIKKQGITVVIVEHRHMKINVVDTVHDMSKINLNV